MKHKRIASTHQKHGCLIFLLILTCYNAACINQQSSVQAPFSGKREPSSYKPIPAVGIYKQSPWIDYQMDADGNIIPPINERLPSIPVVVDLPNAEVGSYTSEEIIIDDGPPDNTDYLGVDFRLSEWYLRDEPLMKYAADGSGQLIGNVFQSCEIEDNYTKYTFSMRPGLRWSDGSFVTTEDIRFMVEDCWTQKEFYASAYHMNALKTRIMPPWFEEGNIEAETVEAQRGIPTVHILDDLTFQIIYRKPFYQLSSLLTQQNSYSLMMLMPSAYLKQYHPFYAEHGMLGDELIKTAASNNIKLSDLEMCGHANIWYTINSAITDYKIPTLGPWSVVSNVLDNDDIILERNPYYWKVDTHNQQLPYIDRIRLVIYDNQNSVNYHIRYGFGMNQPSYARSEYDFPPTQAGGTQLVEAQNYVNKQNKALTLYDNIVKNESSGGFRFMLGNQDEWWQEMVRNVVFRKAICLAVDGYRLAQAVGGYTAQPFNNWVYDPDTANAMLDQVLPSRDINNYRTWGGIPVVMRIMYRDYDEQPNAAAEVLATCFNEIGIMCELVNQTPNSDMRLIDTAAHIAVDMDLRKFDTLPTYIWQRAEFYVIDYQGFLWYYNHGEVGRAPLSEIDSFYEKLNSLMLTSNLSMNEITSELDRLMLEDALCYPGIRNISWPIVADSRLINIPNQTTSLQEAFRNANLWFIE